MIGYIGFFIPKNVLPQVSQRVMITQPALLLLACAMLSSEQRDSLKRFAKDGDTKTYHFNAVTIVGIATLFAVW